MTITATAAVARERTFTLEEVHLDAPRADEVLVRIHAVGLCHTDLVFRDAVPGPAVLGHEGSGVVQEVGRDVVGIAPGDRVVLSFASCGRCLGCLSGRPALCEGFGPLNTAGIRADGSAPVHTADGEPAYSAFFGQSSFATHAVTHWRNVVRLPDDVDDDLLTIAGPLGCGVQTGAGAVINSLRVQPGSSVLVLGCGSVGLSALLAARWAGASTIIVADLFPSRIELARELGATHVMDAGADDVVETVRSITGDGVDFSIEASGSPVAGRAAVEALRLGGAAGLLGLVAPGDRLDVDYQSVLGGRRVMGVIEGDAVPQVFIPQLLALHRAGVFPFERLVRTYPFADIAQAVADSEAGSTVKAVLTLG